MKYLFQWTGVTLLTVALIAAVIVARQHFSLPFWAELGMVAIILLGCTAASRRFLSPLPGQRGERTP